MFVTFSLNCVYMWITRTRLLSLYVVSFYLPPLHFHLRIFLGRIKYRVLFLNLIFHFHLILFLFRCFFIEIKKPWQKKASGLAIFCAGIWMEVELHKYLELNVEYSDFAPYILVGTGAFILLISTLACCCTVKGHPTLLYLV